MQSTPREILPLTSLRFFAAALVVLEHLQMLPGLEWVGFKSNFPGIAGVRIFFVLSGFIISYTYWHRDWSGGFGANAKDFYWSRFARIYPLHWLMFFLALPLGLQSNTARVSIENFPWLLTLTDRLWPGTPIMAQPVKAAWTLSCEILFYLCTPLLFLFLTRRRNPLIASAALFAGFTTAIVLLSLEFPRLNWSAYLEMPQFLLGILGYHLWRQFDFKRHSRALLVSGILLLAGAASLGNLDFRPELLLAYAPGALLLILGCASATGRIEAFLSRPFPVLLGHASYALYLLHDPTMRSLRALLHRHEIILPFPLNILAAMGIFALLIVGSILCFKLYENPARLKLRAWRRPKSSPAEKPGLVRETTPV